MNTTALSTSIFQLLDDPTLVPERRWVEAMLLQYPAFIAPAALLLERDPNLPADYRRQLTARIALLAGDRRALAMRIDQEAKALAAQFPPEPAAPDPSTENTIEGFLDRYSTADHDREAAVLERLIFNPVAPDYAATLDDDDDVATASQSEQDALIAAFINSHPDTDTAPAKAPKAAKTAAAAKPEPAENVSFSESLANDYIRHHQYAKAYDILLRLSQSGNHHSPYLHDQLQYLRKLIDCRAQ